MIKYLNEHIELLEFLPHMFQKADLNGVDLSGANLSGANLRWANMKKMVKYCRYVPKEESR